jgi:hypothetical protein
MTTNRKDKPNPETPNEPSDKKPGGSSTKKEIDLCDDALHELQHEDHGHPIMDLVPDPIDPEPIGD